MRLSPGTLRALRIIGVGLFLALNLVNTWRKGGDFDDYFAAGRRMLDHNPLYAGSTPAYGFVGPPAQALLFAPLALLDPQVSKVLWFVLNIVLLWYALATWLGLCFPTPNPARPHDPEMPAIDPRPMWRRGAGRFRSLWGILPILAVAAPLQSQFEHQNLNVVLLALAAFASQALVRGLPGPAGAALGIAAAIKVYPALALVWLALRRQWSAFGTGVAVAIAVSITPAFFSGLDAFFADARDWQTLAASGWPTRRANQSIAAMWGRFLLGEDAVGYPTLTFDHSWVLGLTAASALLLITPLIIALYRVPSYRYGLIEELACVNGVAILLSPIAWEHYWVGFFPLFLLLGMYARQPRQTSRPIWWATVAFWTGLVCITVLSRPVVGAGGARIVRALSLDTWAGLLLCVTYATILANRRVTARLSVSVHRVSEIAQADDRDGRRAGGGRARSLLRRVGGWV